ncbi:hypothetical protein HNP37_001955 [Flavobacterium nitrogenifigens]|uniref:DUF3300 domain-containing protein n=2 Tax=Flavobacterium TaxID=237 RepID=A0A7W7IWJ7_9FLAO|nr:MULTISPECIES: hypothetical protein [Flavobacterium]MBB4801894.1 hypothetical protein [Flavobacterium nitrogenifigens]MBB6386852.1 hypothetical protein [Flavobacterium notoginsengisoli]
MKTKLLLIAMIALVFGSCAAQSQTTVYAKNSDISDNLDLRAVASMFGESANLQDFERRLNDPKYQISNLDLNGDDEVDYLRVIESVENRTHVVIIQAVLDRDVYQDIATIDVERDNYNKVSVQVVGNTYLYGASYIYEPVYSVVPVIYSSFWVTNYRPYYSTWYWGYYPTYYTAWRPYPVYRYRNNVNVCINVHNSYNYVNVRRSYRAPAIYETRRTYGYERMRPNYSFAERHSNTTNRYELDQRRVASREANRNSYNTNRSNTSRPVSSDNRTPNRNYAENRNSTYRTSSDRNTDRDYNSSNRTVNRNTEGNVNRDYSNRGNNSARVENTPRTESASSNNTRVTSRGNSENRGFNRETSSQRSENRNYSQNRVSTTQSAPAQRAEMPRSNSENRSSSNREYSARPAQSQQRSESPRASQETSRVSQESRGGQPQRESGSSNRGGGGRRG